MNAAIAKVSDRLAALAAKYADDPLFKSIVAAVIGVLAGVATALLKWCINAVSEFVFGHLEHWWTHVLFSFFPLVGILLAVVVTRYIIRRPMDHGSERIRANLTSGNYDISPSVTIGPVIATSLTVGLGGSAGAEGPSALTGAAIGSNIGRLLKLQRESLYNLIAIGGAAGIAGIFIAPIGGVMYALEVLKVKGSLRTVLPMTVAAVVAALTCSMLRHSLTDFYFFAEPQQFDAYILPFALLCGVFCGIYSVYYRSMMAWSRRLFGFVNSIWVKALAGGTMMAVALYLFPSLYGEGYRTMRLLIDNSPYEAVHFGLFGSFGAKEVGLPLLLAALMLVKPLATSATNDSGGVGGDFTPMLFAGAVTGFLFAAAMNAIFGTHLPVYLFTFFGMAGVLAGVAMAPLMGVFICAEIAGMYSLVLPLGLTVLASYLVVHYNAIFNKKKSVKPSSSE